MFFRILLSLVLLINVFCDDTKKKEKSVEELVEKGSASLTGFTDACTTITDEVIIKVLTKENYNKDSVLVKLKYENMMAKNYPLCKNMKLNFPLYPVITPTVIVKDIADSMDYLFDTLGPGESIIKDFNLSRYCYFDSGSYRVEFLYTTNASQYQNEKLKGIKLSVFELLIK